MATDEAFLNSLDHDMGALTSQIEDDSPKIVILTSLIEDTSPNTVMGEPGSPLAMSPWRLNACLKPKSCPSMAPKPLGFAPTATPRGVPLGFAPIPPPNKAGLQETPRVVHPKPRVVPPKPKEQPTTLPLPMGVFKYAWPHKKFLDEPLRMRSGVKDPKSGQLKGPRYGKRGGKKAREAQEERMARENGYEEIHRAEIEAGLAGEAAFIESASSLNQSGYLPFQHVVTGSGPSSSSASSSVARSYPQDQHQYEWKHGSWSNWDPWNK